MNEKKSYLIFDTKTKTYKFNLDGWKATAASFAVSSICGVGLYVVTRETFWLMYQAYKLTTGLL